MIAVLRTEVNTCLKIDKIGANSTNALPQG